MARRAKRAKGRQPPASEAELVVEYRAEYQERLGKALDPLKRRNAFAVELLGYAIMVGLGFGAWHVGASWRADSRAMDVRAEMIGSFARAPAVIERSEIIVGDSIDDYAPPVYCLDFAYRYEIEGQAYQGRHFDLTETPCYTDRERVESIAGAWPVGRDFQAWVDPNNANRAYISNTTDVEYRDDAHAGAVSLRYLAIALWVLVGGLLFRSLLRRRRPAVERRVERELNESWRLRGRKLPEATQEFSAPQSPEA